MWAEEIKPITYKDGILKVSVPHDFVKDMLEDRFTELIHAAVADVAGKPVVIEFEVVEEALTPPPLSPPGLQPLDPFLDPNVPTDADFASIPLNPKYTFENFVVGNSNNFAHAAAQAVSRAPAMKSKEYNPLFLHGGVGLGKTHLMQAIGHRVQELNIAAEILYVSGETFLYHVVTAIREDRTAAFRRRYRNVDLWLVDDIQFIASRESSRTEADFFHTFNALYETNKQIVISSDRPPKDLQLMDDRLRSRFEWGLIVDIKPPDRETRIAILQKKAESENMPIPDEVIFYIAHMIQSNIRILEGALIKVIAYASLTGRQVTLALAKESLRDYSTGERLVDITIEDIQRAAARYYDVELADLIGKGRSKEVVVARQVAMYLCRELTANSFPDIGQRFGGKDHSTVMHACDKIGDMVKQGDPEALGAINDIREKLENFGVE
jgi:chromosomal replication initiator protein